MTRRGAGSPALRAACGIAVLSVTSSLDNFLVGASLGLGGFARLSLSLNGIISFCNALGALSSTFVGRLFGAKAPAAAGCVGGAIFLWLGVGEAVAAASGGDSELSRAAAEGRAWVVAIPMTLNNLAGGVAGGLSGYSALAMGSAAFAASFSMMQLGFAAGRFGGEVDWLDPHALAAAAFAVLAVSQLKEALDECRNRGGAAEAAAPPAGAAAYEALPAVAATTYAPLEVAKGQSD